MTSIALVAPAPFDARTGGYIYDRRIAEGLRRLGWTVDIVELDSSFPKPTADALSRAAHALTSVGTGTIAIVDSLALGAMPDVIAREAPRLPIVALMHQPLSAAAGLDPTSVVQFANGERHALAAVALVVVTGRAALPLMARYGVPSSRIVVVEPGTDRVPLADGARQRNDSREAGAEQSRPLELLAVGTITEGKGHESLLEALASLRDLPWRLTCAGSLTRDPGTAARVQAAVARLELSDRVSFLGELDGQALDARYAHADVAVLPTRQETYGMAVAEALAHGLPVVATATGAIADLVGDDAGLVVPVGNRAALTSALAHIIGDAGLRERLADGARRKRDRLPTWDEAARTMSQALTRLCSVPAGG